MRTRTTRRRRSRTRSTHLRSSSRQGAMRSRHARNTPKNSLSARGARSHTALFCAIAPRFFARARQDVHAIAPRTFLRPAPSCTLHKTTYCYCRYAMLLHSIVIVNFTANYLEHRHSAVAMILSNSRRVQQYSGRRWHSERLVRCLHSPAKLLNMRPQPTQGLHLQTSWTRM